MTNATYAAKLLKTLRGAQGIERDKSHQEDGDGHTQHNQVDAGASDSSEHLVFSNR